MSLELQEISDVTKTAWKHRPSMEASFKQSGQQNEMSVHRLT